jgi:hypothetical protein
MDPNEIDEQLEHVNELMKLPPRILITDGREILIKRWAPDFDINDGTLVGINLTGIIIQQRAIEPEPQGPPPIMGKATGGETI